MVSVIVRVIPILLLLALGNVIRARKMLSAQSVEELKGLIVNIALPAVLFTAFLDMRLERAYLGLFALILLICLLQLAYGFALRRIFAIRHEYFPFLMTGFEFGMVGISLFGSAWGLANVGYLALIDLSHELFIWFVFVTILTAKRDGVSNVTGTLRGFVTSPLIIAIVVAVVLNAAGLGGAFRTWPLGSALMETFALLGNLLIPLILVIIGFGMGLSRRGLRDAAAVVFARLVILLPLALFASRVIIRNVLALEPAFEIALFTFLILPPPYIIPLFMKRDVVEERRYANNVLSVYTLVSLVIFIVYFVFNPVIAS